ncbi:DNA-directed RNA polymerase subunit omega [Heliobacterium chlorum]|uniref:DNA-directed RNA polymerase subunit omega n=1 Tax=Heliobacterium chlorum TaxID=2698 RepID=UPI001A9B3FB1|nr:DNA-directed RNA polymerase subunit omega [Heliobacterium chlorum]
MIYINKPSLDELLGRVESKYAMVILAALRARSLNDPSKPAEPLVHAKKEDKPVSIALREIAEGLVRYERVNDKESVEAPFDRKY